MKKMRLIALLLAMLLVLSACGTSEQTQTTGGSESGMDSDSDTGVSAGEAADSVDTADLFSNRDKEGTYEKNGAGAITLNGSTAACDSGAVEISGSTVTITDEGVFVLTGSLDDGMIVVNAEKSDKVQLVLDGVSVNSGTSAAIYVLQADKVFITLADGSENTLSNGGEFIDIDENAIDSVVFSKEDLTLNGSGSLTVESPAGHGIVSKDELTITGGTYTITTASHGITGKDSIAITGADMTIVSGKDGIHGQNDDDASLGFVYIESGTFAISAEGDGISSTACMQIDEGSFDLVTGGGSANASHTTSGSWGNYMGGGMGGMGGMGGRDHSGGTASSSGSDDSTSIKGIKATGNMAINGGSFVIDSADDAIHSNGDITISDGIFQIASGDDGVHADNALTISGGTFHITESYEGLEALELTISGGDISLTASDDGLNAAGGADQSGMGGFRGNDMFGGGMGGSSSGTILISGGKLYINASGDGIDANGTLTISGGYTVVCGPTQGDTATLDYDRSGVITGGTFIGTGASNMAQTFSDSEQGVIAVTVGSQRAGTEIVLTDSKGNVVISYTPELSFQVVILSSPDMVKGEEYTITVGTASGTFSAS